MQRLALVLAWSVSASHGRRMQFSTNFKPTAAFSTAGRDLRLGTKHPASTSRSSALMHDKETAVDRRQALGRGLAALAAAAGVAAGMPVTPATAAGEPSVKMYFGAGCFWHVQHEFVGEEVAALSRGPGTVTALSGYAGGTMQGTEAKTVCYHNPRQQTDYGELGMTEVVQVEIPQSQVPRFARKYISLFGEKGYRHDPMDRGGEYRSAIGLPGGESSPLFSEIKNAVAGSPMKLVSGKGDEPDTIRDKAVLVYDSDKFPFYPAEVYHQFHDDFMGAPYGRAYNALQKQALEVGFIKKTGCPEMQSWM
mmetsp:Transcript_145835/g.257234  ORF Transcript_145835/g.257234 Transcript_145835/m.257234 type:complete len:308 (+) Transcript_145835:78-1001(+)